MCNKDRRYFNAIPQEEEAVIASAFDAWLDEQPQETKELARLHIFNLRAALTPRKVAFGEQSAKVLVAAVYMQVRKFDIGARA